MRTLKFECDCGQGHFTTATDNLPYAAHVIPDQEYDAFSAIVDDAIENPGLVPTGKDRACMAWRVYAMRRVWQCYACGSVYVEAQDGSHHRFVPSSGAIPKNLFERR